MLTDGPAVTCGACGKSATFAPPWRWPVWPASWAYYDARTLRPACSDACEAAATKEVA